MQNEQRNKGGPTHNSNRPNHPLDGKDFTAKEKSLLFYTKKYKKPSFYVQKRYFDFCSTYSRSHQQHLLGHQLEHV